jgi:AraC family transcriptional activator of mtrCDE
MLECCDNLLDRLIRSSATMDTLSHLLFLFTIRTSLDTRCELSAPWVLDEPSSTPDKAVFHVIVEGAARVDVAGRAPIDLRSGDVVVLPGGAAHRLHAGPQGGAWRDVSRVADLAPMGLLQRKGNAGDGPSTVILCGNFVFDEAARRVLLGALPPVMLVRSSRQDDFTGLHALVRLQQHETAAERAGSSAVVIQLSGALFTLLLRAWLEGADDAAYPGVLAVLTDRRLGTALRKMLEAPAHPWRVDDLAQACHMSRATFARLFNKLCGATPGDVLASLRMALAARELARTRRAVGEVALAVGYQSEAAFNRVFKRHYGIGPGGYRRGHQASADIARS